MLASPPVADPSVTPAGRRRWWPAAIGFGVSAAAGVGLSAAVARGGPILAARWGILVRLAVWTVAWAAAVWFAFRLPKGRATVAAVLAAGAVVRLAALAGPPTLSDDLYRYSWDGRVQAAGVDPYRYTPSSVHLVSLREPWLWPDDAGCAALHREPGCSRVNRETSRTIYPPLAQAWFAAVYRVAGIGSHHKAWQVAGLAGELALLALLPLALRAWGRDERWAALYALSPFPVIEVVNNGHVDGLAALLVVAALVAAARRRPWWAGALIGAAALVKLYPAVLLVGLVGLAGVSGRRLVPIAKAALGAAGVVAAGYLPHVLAVGPKVVGYLPQYLREEHYDTAGRYLLAGTAPVAVAALVAVAAWAIWRRPEPPVACAALLGALLLAATPVQPWYAVTLLAVATVAARPAWALVAAAGYPYFFAVILDAGHQPAIGRAAYGVALAGAAASAAVTRHRRQHDHGAGSPTAAATGRDWLVPVSVVAAVVLVGPVAGQVAAQESAGIPSLPVLGPPRDAYDGDLGDPFVLPVKDGGSGHVTRFVAFGTGDFPARVPTATTADLMTWQRGPDALPDLPAWAGADPKNALSWAPAALQRSDGTFVLYISLPERSSGRECIAAEVANRAEGPYTDPGPGPLLCQRDAGGSIDPSLVTDRDGGLHLLWKNDGNSVGKPAALWEQSLAADGLHLTGRPHFLMAANAGWQGGIVEEPAAMPASGGGWWLFYSGNWFDTAAYGTGVAWCAELSGPCRPAQAAPVLATAGPLQAPGGLETFADAAGNRWAVFDTWNRPARNGRFYCCRSLYLARILST